jgi:hypothetical protein
VSDAGGWHPPYVPVDYERLVEPSFTLWRSGTTPGDHVDLLVDVCGRTLESVGHTLDFRPRRTVHVCCFHTNVEAREALARDIHPTMALAPYAGEHASLIVLQSPAADRRNGDPERLYRLLLHEITHQCVAEISGSRKILGDDNRDMRVPTWLNEGLAEYVANTGSGRDAFNRSAVESLSAHAPASTFDALNRSLDDLDADGRRAAFVTATGAVGLLVRRRGLPAVFRRVRDIAAVIGNDASIDPERLRAMPLPSG